MNLDIQTGDTVPQRPSTAEPNPFVEGNHFPTPEGKTVIVTLPSSTDDEKKYVDRIVKQAQQAGKAVRTDEYPEGSTTRVHREPVKIGTGKNAKDGTRLTFWTVTPIKRKRKNGASPAAVSADNPNTATGNAAQGDAQTAENAGQA